MLRCPMFLLFMFTSHFFLSLTQSPEVLEASNVTALFSFLQYPSTVSLKAIHLIVLLTHSIEYESTIAESNTTLNRPDTLSVTIQCLNNVTWRCSGKPCLIIKSDTNNNVTISGCIMIGGGVYAMDEHPENSSMSLSIRDGVMDGEALGPLVQAEGVRNVTITNMTIRNGKFMAPGGCVSLNNVRGHFTLTNSTFQSCNAFQAGGCLNFDGNTSFSDDYFLKRSAVVNIKHTNFKDCQSTMNQGGGLRLRIADIISIHDVNIENSWSLFNGGCANIVDVTYLVDIVQVSMRNCTVRALKNLGGALSVSDVSSIQVLSSEFYDAFSDSDGGCVRVNNCQINCSFENVSMRNCASTTGIGSGLSVSTGDYIRVRNVTIFNSVGSDFGGCLFVGVAKSVEFENVLVSNCSSKKEGSCVQLRRNWAPYDVFMTNVTARDCHCKNLHNSSGLYLTGFKTAKAQNMHVMGSDGNCVGVTNFDSFMIEDSSVRTCNSGVGVDIGGSSSSSAVAMRNIVVDPSPTSTMCIQVKNASSTFTRLWLKDCGKGSSFNVQVLAPITFPWNSLVNDNNFSFARVGTEGEAAVSTSFSSKRIENAKKDSATVGFVASCTSAVFSVTLGQTSARSSVMFLVCSSFEETWITKSINQSFSSVENEMLSALVGYGYFLVLAMFIDCGFILHKAISTRRSILLQEVYHSVTSPSVFIRTVAATIGNGVMASARLASEEEDIQLLPIGVACMGFYCIVVGLLCRETLRSKREFMLYEPTASSNSSSFSVRSFCLTEGGEWHNVNPDYLYREKYGHIVACYKEKRQWFGVFEYSFTFIAAVCAGIQTTNRTTCVTIYSILTALYGIQTLLLFRYRPYHTDREYFISVATMLLSITGIVVRVLEIYDAMDPSVAISPAVFMSVSVVSGVSVMWNGILKFSQGAPLIEQPQQPVKPTASSSCEMEEKILYRQLTL
eukprot:PhF_6_TR43011/c0_g1_i2/m.65724